MANVPIIRINSGVIHRIRLWRTWVFPSFRICNPAFCFVFFIRIANSLRRGVPLSCVSRLRISSRVGVPARWAGVKMGQSICLLIRYEFCWKNYQKNFLKIWKQGYKIHIFAPALPIKFVGFPHRDSHRWGRDRKKGLWNNDNIKRV
jgi:hypothetical protein